MDEAGSTTARTELLAQLVRLLGPDGVLVDAAARKVYARDASHLSLGEPLAVVLPVSEDQVRTVLAACAAAGVPVVCRGSGTGLSGGALPSHDAVVLSTARLSGLGPVDPDRRTVRVQPGVLNTMVTRHAAACDMHFAPDPSSQAAATVGGNIAENAGGPHCLRLGVTLQHLRRLEWADAEGRAWSSGRDLAAERGIDLRSILCGSEGTLGVVTGATVALTPDPTDVSTLLAVFPRLDDAATAVSSLFGAGLLPVALEIVDQAMLRAVEAAFAFGFPTDVEAAMIIEFAGVAEEIAADSARAESLLVRAGARDVSRAADAAERVRLWQCRKRAFGAVGRLSPSYVSMDVVVPLGELTGLVREIQEIRDRCGVRIATAYHAGDGNLHPGVHFDDRDPEQVRKAHVAADEIIRAALARDGSVTGEHGVGIEKLHALPWQLDGEAARLMAGIKTVFDPEGQLNPGKALPTGDVTWRVPKPAPTKLEFRWDSLVVTAPAATSLRQVQSEALERGLWVPVGLPLPPGPQCDPDVTVGDLVDHLLPGPSLLPGGTVRDFLLELWGDTGDGRRFHAGAPVFKNVAGYDLVHMLCGSGGTLAVPAAATLQLRPAPAVVAAWRFTADGGDPDRDKKLAPVIRLLTTHTEGLAAPMLLVDSGDGDEPTEITVFAAGRDEAWDLGALARDLAGLASATGLALRDHRQERFMEGTRLWTSDLVPNWALASEDWTAVSATEQGRGFWLPRHVSRAIWQARPRLVWDPDPARADAPSGDPDWYADPFRVGGRIGATPPPEVGVPTHILRGLKALFDPGGRLSTPSWSTDPIGDGGGS